MNCRSACKTLKRKLPKKGRMKTLVGKGKALAYVKVKRCSC